MRKAKPTTNIGQNQQPTLERFNCLYPNVGEDKLWQNSNKQTDALQRGSNSLKRRRVGDWRILEKGLQYSRGISGIGEFGKNDSGVVTYFGWSTKRPQSLFWFADSDYDFRWFQGLRFQMIFLRKLFMPVDWLLPGRKSPSCAHIAATKGSSKWEPFENGLVGWSFYCLLRKRRAETCWNMLD